MNPNNKFWYCIYHSQGQVCGLCGNYDGNSKNDFTTRSQETVADVLTFGNSWKASSSCPNAQLLSDPCASNRYRAAWSQKQCSIITSSTFESCHSQVIILPASILYTYFIQISMHYQVYTVMVFGKLHKAIFGTKCSCFLCWSVEWSAILSVKSNIRTYIFTTIATSTLPLTLLIFLLLVFFSLYFT